MAHRYNSIDIESNRNPCGSKGSSRGGRSLATRRFVYKSINRSYGTKSEDFYLISPQAGLMTNLTKVLPDIQSMKNDADDSSDVDEDFFNALALLHSNEDDSVEKLFKMLDFYMMQKYGSSKTLMNRIPKKYLQRMTLVEKSSAILTPRMPDDIARQKLPLNNQSGESFKEENVAIIRNDGTGSASSPITIFDSDLEDYNEEGDIPRISIPDEGSADGLLCKICNGAKLGPLILLECQECQEVYHPLCHQPPVVDIDVYDPRIVWRCTKCMVTSSITSSIVELEEEMPIVSCDKLKIKDYSASSSGSKNVRVTSKRSRSDLDDEDSIDFIENNSSNCRDSETAKESGKVIKKYSKSSNQLRKRIGSKLSVSRGSIKP